MGAVCITVDDYGLRAEGDAVIEELAAARRIDAVSIMMHADASIGGLGAIRASGVATGLHLVLVAERPLAARGLVDRDGFLPASWRSLLLAPTPHRPREVRTEVRAQLERYLSCGLRLDFVNSHQHTHLFPPIWRIVREELSRLSATPFVRAPAHAVRTAKEAVLTASSMVSFARVAPSAVLRSFGLEWSGRASVADVEATLCTIPASVSELAELVFHPGAHPRGAAARHRRWRYAWEAEAELLASGAIDELVSALSLERRQPVRAAMPIVSEAR